ncbi:NTP transferase domain-containing protein [Litorivicinus sp.]|nr:NTP transferase domain-containing protein [Litorivicinus sp.]MDC1239988.1 NTP transferase domain-containing protein [Litorivicinus sp.]
MKSAILITARLKSTRLPMKVIKNIHGKPMIEHMLDRLKLAHEPEEIIVCTSHMAEDDPLERIAIEQGVQCFRGDPDDVLLRLMMAADQYGVETIINCTADNPLVDPIYIDKLYRYHASGKHDFTKIEGLPWGTFSYAISFEAMVRACEIKNELDTEVWHGYFMDTGLFNCGVLDVRDPDVFWPNLRLTVDWPEDFALITKLFDELYCKDKIFSLSAAVNLCREFPEIPAINAGVMQKVGIPIKLKNDVGHKNV